MMITAGCISPASLVSAASPAVSFGIVSNGRTPSPIVDAHLHYYTFTSKTHGFEELITRMDESGVTKTVLFGTGLVKIGDEEDPKQP